MSDLWKGDFGDEYTDRNQGDALHASNLSLFSRILSRVDVKSVLELGANVGMNIRAINELIPGVETRGVECNKKAWEELKKVCTAGASCMDLIQTDIPVGIVVYRSFIYDLMLSDLVFTKGVLIHIPPERLAGVYELMYTTSRRYIMVAEYYNPTPVEVQYRGQYDRLWKRDFAGDLMSKYPLRLLDYGFVYHGGSFPQDDITWFLMEKEG